VELCIVGAGVASAMFCPAKGSARRDEARTGGHMARAITGCLDSGSNALDVRPLLQRTADAG